MVWPTIRNGIYVLCSMMTTTILKIGRCSDNHSELKVQNTIAYHKMNIFISVRVLIKQTQKPLCKRTSYWIRVLIQLQKGTLFLRNRHHFDGYFLLFLHKRPDDICKWTNSLFHRVQSNRLYSKDFRLMIQTFFFFIKILFSSLLCPCKQDSLT